MFPVKPANTPFNFGASNVAQQQQPAAGQFSALPAATPQQQPVQPAQPTIGPDTPFDQLPQQLKDQLLQFEKFLQDQIAKKDDVAAALEADFDSPSTSTLASINNDYESLSEFTERVRSHLDNTMQRVDLLRANVANSLKHADARARMWEKIDAGGYRLSNSGYSFFFEFVSDVESRLESFRNSMEEVGALVTSTLSGPPQLSPSQLTDIMRAQHEAFLALAGRIASIHEDIDILRDQFIVELKSRGIHSNPFNSHPYRSSFATSETGLPVRGSVRDSSALLRAQQQLIMSDAAAYGRQGVPYSPLAMFNPATAAATTTAAAATPAATPSAFGFGSAPAASPFTFGARPATTTTSTFGAPASTTLPAGSSPFKFGSSLATPATPSVGVAASPFPSVGTATSTPGVSSRSLSFAGVGSPSTLTTPSFSNKKQSTSTASSSAWGGRPPLSNNKQQRTK